jgi:hypothetical protein
MVSTPSYSIALPRFSGALQQHTKEAWQMSREHHIRAPWDVSSGELTPNPSLEPTRSGRHRLAAPGYCVHCPSAAKRRPPPRAAQLER